jgi:hypothetical protein
MDGQEAQSRFPDGFVLVDAHSQYVWVYDWNASGEFEAREVAELDEAKLDRARTEAKYDIRAYDPEVMS